MLWFLLVQVRTFNSWNSHSSAWRKRIVIFLDRSAIPYRISVAHHAHLAILHGRGIARRFFLCFFRKWHHHQWPHINNFPIFNSVLVALLKTFLVKQVWGNIFQALLQRNERTNGNTLFYDFLEMGLAFDWYQTIKYSRTDVFRSV